MPSPLSLPSPFAAPTGADADEDEEAAGGSPPSIVRQPGFLVADDAIVAPEATWPKDAAVWAPDSFDNVSLTLERVPRRRGLFA